MDTRVPVASGRGGVAGMYMFKAGVGGFPARWLATGDTFAERTGK